MPSGHNKKVPSMKDWFSQYKIKPKHYPPCKRCSHPQGSHSHVRLADGKMHVKRCHEEGCDCPHYE